MLLRQLESISSCQPNTVYLSLSSPICILEARPRVHYNHSRPLSKRLSAILGRRLNKHGSCQTSAGVFDMFDLSNPEIEDTEVKII